MGNGEYEAGCERHGITDVFIWGQSGHFLASFWLGDGMGKRKCVQEDGEEEVEGE